MCLAMAYLKEITGFGRESQMIGCGGEAKNKGALPKSVYGFYLGLNCAVSWLDRRALTKPRLEKRG